MMEQADMLSFQCSYHHARPISISKQRLYGDDLAKNQFIYNEFPKIFIDYQSFRGYGFEGIDISLICFAGRPFSTCWKRFGKTNMRVRRKKAFFWWNERLKRNPLPPSFPPLLIGRCDTNSLTHKMIFIHCFPKKNNFNHWSFDK